MGHVADALEVHGLVEAVRAATRGAVAQARDVVVAAVEAAVGDGGQDHLARFGAMHRLVRTR